MQRTNRPIAIKLTPSLKNSYDDLADNAVKLSNVHQHDPNAGYVIELTSQHHRPVTSFFYPVIFTNRVPPNEISFPSTLRYHFGYSSHQIYDFTLQKSTVLSSEIAAEVTFEIKRLIPFKPDRHIDVKEAEIIPLIKNRFGHFPFCLQQHIYLPFGKNLHIELIVTSITSSGRHIKLAGVNESTKITLILASYTNDIRLERIPPVSIPDAIEVPLPADEPEQALQEPDNKPPVFNLNFREKGIGGLDNVLKQIVREVLLSRAMGEQYEAYGLPHTKGFILYGPPGTGKTLIAREIGKLYAAEHITVINGPELKSPLVGQSAANLRAAFAVARNAWLRYGKNSQTEVIIIDEIDVVFPRRSTYAAQESGSQVNNDMVAQILTIIDGIDSPQNIIVIGTTNRFNAIDPALVRPGRLETCIEIPLPDKEARYEILCIHTAKLQANHILAPDIDLAGWAARTEYFTGAELMQLVKKAVHYSIQHSFEIDKDTFTLRLKPGVLATNSVPPVTHEHIERAFGEIRPVNIPIEAIGSSLVSVLRRSGSPVHHLPDDRRDTHDDAAISSLRK